MSSATPALWLPSPPADRHRPLAGTKLYFLVNRGTCVWTTCPGLLPGRLSAQSRTCNLEVTSSACYHYTTKPLVLGEHETKRNCDAQFGTKILWDLCNKLWQSERLVCTENLYCCASLRWPGKLYCWKLGERRVSRCVSHIWWCQCWLTHSSVVSVTASDNDEPLLSGSGTVSKDVTDENLLDSWHSVLKRWHQNVRQRPRQVRSLVRKGIPEPLRDEVWQLLASCTESPELLEAYRTLIPQVSSTEQCCCHHHHLYRLVEPAWQVLRRAYLPVSGGW